MTSASSPHAAAAPDPQGGGARLPSLPAENVYGHRRRLEWLAGELESSDVVLDFGCGTGSLITIPLLVLGYRVTGIDIHQESIVYGRAILERAALDPEALRCGDISDLDASYDAAIAAEVFEHLSDQQLARILAVLHDKVRPGGKLLVTVPNGYGLFELESMLYEALRERAPFRWLRARLRTDPHGREGHHPMSLGQTPHQQRFTWGRLRIVLGSAGFAVEEFQGATLTCGPFSARLLTKSRTLMAINAWLGRRLPRFAADYYVRASRVD